MSEGGWTSKELADIGDKMVEGMIAGLESTDVTIGEAIKRFNEAMAEEYGAQKLPIDRYGIKPHPHTPIKNKNKLKELEALFNRIISEFIQERKENMKIEDCKTVPEFFGVYQGDHIWIEGNLFVVEGNRLRSNFDYLSAKIDSKALVGCLTGQLKWSRTEPPTEEEIKILREIAAWFPQSKRLFTTYGDIYLGRGVSTFMPFGGSIGGKKSKAYEILAPILEKHGEVDLDDYRDTEAEEEEPPFGSCDFCGYEFDSELINEYEITHCPKCGEEIEESVDLDW